MPEAKKYHQLLSAFLLIAISLPSFVSAQSKVGTSAGQFLGISVGPRATSMGGAFVAMGNDVSSLYWNPGAVARAGKSQFSFSNTAWLVGSRFQWAGVMFTLDGANTIGVSVTHLDYGSEEVTTVHSPDGTGEFWTANDISIALSYSRSLTDRFSIGGSLKYVGQSIWNETASTFAVDLGLLFVTGFNDMRLGVSISNFGGDLTLDGRDLLQQVDIDPDNSGANKSLVGKLKTDPWSLPLFFRVGVAIDVIKNDLMSLTLSADGLRPSDNVESYNFGTEVGWNDMLFLRAGFKSLFRTGYRPMDQAASQEGVAFGGGIKYGIEGIATLEIDYAFQQFGLFGNLNTIAVSIAF